MADGSFANRIRDSSSQDPVELWRFIMSSMESYFCICLESLDTGVLLGIYFSVISGATGYGVG